MVRDFGRWLYLWACERLYHELAGVYDPISRLVSAGAWPSWRRTALAHLHGPQVLELGIGTGELLAELGAERFADVWQVTGLELSPAMQAVAARRLAQGGQSLARVQAPAQQMPFAAGSFDSIVATFPAPYILQAETLAECARVLRPGGRLVVAGLWVRLGNERLRRLAPFFYADPPASSIAALADRVVEGGFAVSWHTQASGWAEVPVLVAELPLKIFTGWSRVDQRKDRLKRRTRERAFYPHVGARQGECRSRTCVTGSETLSPPPEWSARCPRRYGQRIGILLRTATGPGKLPPPACHGRTS